MSKYTIGLDFGTLSCRAVIVDVENGSVLASADSKYPHGVMTECLPTGEILPDNWALQHPKDYIETMIQSIKQAVDKSKIDKNDIIGIGVDFTASTTLPVFEDGTPLCYLQEFCHNKHAYVKLWKHHGSDKQVKRLNLELVHSGLQRIKYYGGSFHHESSLPRLLAVYQEAPEVYSQMNQWIEAGDWIVWQLTGNLTRCISGAGIKNMYDCITNTYPEKDFLRKIDPDFGNVYEEKCSSVLLPLGSKAGELTNDMAQKLDLPEGIAVAAANMDGHVSAPVIGMKSTTQALAVIGTSCGWFTLSDDMKEIPGICGSVAESMLPDMVCHEAGQSCVGDMYQWFVDNSVPADYYQAASDNNMDIQMYLTQLAEKLRPGQSGLLALDWFNGNRSILADSDLSGLIIGMTLQTKPEEIYRALLEASAFGGRMIVENFISNGLPVNSVIAAGGISQKNCLAMQIYADVLGIPVYIAGSSNGPAHGSALYGAVAAGHKHGGYDSVSEATEHMQQPFTKVYTPIQSNVKTYNKIYSEYKRLHDYFGRTDDNPMKRLIEIRREQNSMTCK